ncbi:MAG: DegT/DnrJ/EryC1/StrS family aminotransferase [Frankiaceae bacterium]|nr:DegT/DnrJ/EryC1/StrS family aminotransferase [Frankiaceae bacterium]
MTSYPLATTSWDERELEAIRAVMASGHFTMGERVREFESAFAAFVGSRYAVMSNSGSSANLLMVAAACHRADSPLRPGDEVIVPAVSWGTTYYPVAQYGLRLRFVDVDLRTLNLDVAQAAAAVTPRTRAVLAVNLLGAPNQFDQLESLCADNGLLLLEDNCEALGASFAGRQTGTFGAMGTFSFFFSHHMSTMEGGMSVTDDRELAELMTSLRAHGWTRELGDDNLVHPKVGNDFDDLFRFVLPGYNLRPLEMEAAIGLVQLDKLPSMLAERRANATRFLALFRGRDDVIIQEPPGDSSWFGFSFVLSGPLEGRRAQVAAALAAADVECRPIVAGDFTKNPVIKLMPHDIAGELPNAGRIDRDGLFVGNHHYPLDEELQLLARVLDDVSAGAA